MKMRALFLVCALAGCAAGEGRGSLEEREQAGLARELATRTAGEPRRCVPIVQGQALIAVDGRTITYDTPGTLYVSRLGADCPGLRPDTVIVAEVHGGQHCENDLFRTIERGGSSIPGPICRLGRFTPYRR